MKAAWTGEEPGAGPVGFEPTSSAPKAKRISKLPHEPRLVIALLYIFFVAIRQAQMHKGSTALDLSRSADLKVLWAAGVTVIITNNSRHLTINRN